jgi:hypothetical protein
VQGKWGHGHEGYTSSSNNKQNLFREKPDVSRRLGHQDRTSLRSDASVNMRIYQQKQTEEKQQPIRKSWNQVVGPETNTTRREKQSRDGFRNGAERFNALSIGITVDFLKPLPDQCHKDREMKRRRSGNSAGSYFFCCG